MVAFATREPTDEELENFRLVMSLAACGYGGFEGGDATTPPYPSWQWAERAFAAAFNGEYIAGAKLPFDTLVSVQGQDYDYIGIQVKTKGSMVCDNTRAFIEYNNENSRYTDYLNEAGFNGNGIDYWHAQDPNLVGAAINNALQNYHTTAAEVHGENIDLHQSMLVLITWRWSDENPELETTTLAGARNLAINNIVGEDITLADALDLIPDGEDRINLAERGYKRLMARGTIDRPVTFVVNDIVNNARGKIQAAGGSVELAELTLDLTAAQIDKISNVGTINRPIHFTVMYANNEVREKIEDAGGSVTCETKRYEYQIHSFPHLVPDVEHWTWIEGREGLYGYDNEETMQTDLQAGGSGPNAIAWWDPVSRGQMKYYPLLTSAIYSVENWQTLEQRDDDDEINLIEWARGYFSEE